MDELREAAREFFRAGMKKTGWKPYRWAKEAGVSPTTITRPLNDPDWKPVPKLDTLAKLAAAAGMELPSILRQGTVVDLTPVSREIPVVGDVRAGSWERIPDEPNIVEWLPMEVPDYAGADLFAVRVVGKSMDLLYSDGTYVVCAPAAQAGLQEGDCVVVRRWDGDRAETTLKQIERLADGSYILQPRSTQAEFQEAIPIRQGDQLTQNGVEIVGVVLISYRRDRRGRGPQISI